MRAKQVRQSRLSKRNQSQSDIPQHRHMATADTIKKGSKVKKVSRYQCIFICRQCNVIGTFSETGDFKIDTTGTYHGMTINSLTEDVPKPRSQAPLAAKQPPTTPRNSITNDKVAGKPNRKGKRLAAASI